MSMESVSANIRYFHNFCIRKLAYPKENKKDVFCCYFRKASLLSIC